MAHDDEAMETDGAVDEKDTIHFWLNWLKKTKTSKGCKRHRRDATQAWEEFENQPKSEGRSEYRADNQQEWSFYPIYWSATKTIEPAYYSRTPKLIAKRRFDIEDPVALTAATQIERLGEYLIENCEFDATIQAAVADFIHADKATTQLIYKAEMGEEPVRIPLAVGALDGNTGEPIEYVLEDGSIYDDEVFQDEQGYFGQGMQEVVVNKKISIDQVCYDEILHTPSAKCEGEITEKAIYFCMSREEAEERFPDKVGKINWKKEGGKGRKRAKNDDYDYNDSMEDMPGEYLEGWECWCLTNKKVYWVSEQCVEGFLDVKDDPYELREFFPVAPFIIGSKPSKSMFPTPAFIHLQPLIKQLHESTAKVYDLIEGIERRALVDGDEDLVTALNVEGNRYVVAKNLKNIIEKGGIQNMVWFVPVQELVRAITELNALEEKFKAQFYEWFGVPDIVRGESDPEQTLGGQQMAAAASHDRFKYQKKQVKQLVRDSLELMIDMALFVMDDMELAEIMGYQYMDEQEQQNFGAGLELLRNDKSRTVRIDIETDSLSFVDEQMRSAQMAKAVQSVTMGLDKVAQMAQIAPEFAQVGLLTVLHSLETVAPGKEFQNQVKKAVDKLIEQMMNPPEPPPPPPDVEMMKVQLKSQELGIKAQASQMESQAKEAKLQAEFYKLQLEQQKLQQQAAIDSAKVMGDNQRKAQQTEIERLQLQLDQVGQQMATELESRRLMIEEFKAQQQAAESRMEEIRLAHQAETERSAEMLQAFTALKTQQPAVPLEIPAININIEKPAASTKIGEMVQDPITGDTKMVIREVPE